MSLGTSNSCCLTNLIRIAALAILAMFFSHCGATGEKKAEEEVKDEQSKGDSTNPTDGSKTDPSTGSSTTTQESSNQSSDVDQKLMTLQGQVKTLNDAQSRLNAVLTSDFAGCNPAPADDHPIVQKICKVAGGLTDSAKIELRSELASTKTVLDSQMAVLNSSLASLQADYSANKDSVAAQLASLASQVTSVSGSLLSLEGRVTNLESAVAALQALTASLSAALNSSLHSVEIGSENAGAGPIYETVFRRYDKTSIAAYREVFGTAVSLGSSPLSATLSSPNVNLTATAHGFVVGDIIKLVDVGEGRGFNSGDLIGEHVVQLVVSANVVQLKLRLNAKATGTFGGSVGLVQKSVGRAMSTIWQTSSGADAVVRQTSIGSSRYNYVVKSDGSICYSNSSATADYATISAGGADVTCK